MTHRKVLIVEDSEIIQQRLMDVIADLPEMEVVGVTDEAARAGESIQIPNPDVVILDIRLRAGNGFDVLDGIKRNLRRPFIIVITNFAYPEYKEKCIQAGADYFLDKSSEFDRIPQILEDLISQGRES
jgi:DNA-binding NarL/FixJ family response regulator